MKRWLVFAAFLSGPLIGHAQSAPFKLDFPVEFGAPPRHDNGRIDVRVLRLPMADMQKLPYKACTPGHGELTVGCSLHNGIKGYCTIFVPIEVDELDEIRIEMHERRHCLGQEHVTVEGPNGTQMLRWLP